MGKTCWVFVYNPNILQRKFGAMHTYWPTTVTNASFLIFAQVKKVNGDIIASLSTLILSFKGTLEKWLRFRNKTVVYWKIFF